MAIYEDGSVELCPGCPAQNNYLGEADQDSIVVAATRQSTVERDRTEYVFELEVGFVDPEGGKSEVITGWTHVPKNSSKPSKGLRRAESIGKRTARGLIERVSHCSQASVDGEGKRSCPAFSQDVFRAMVDEAQHQQPS
ncbi:MAG TPA: hypothetical protein VIH90_02565 [Candidatus Saccharimonadales bacterium]